MKRVFAFALLLAFTAPAAANDACSNSLPSYVHARKATDARLIVTFERVGSKSGIVHLPTLCQAESTPRGQVPMVYKDARVVLFPTRAVAELTDEEMEGAVAHELGHFLVRFPPAWPTWREYIAIESSVDSIGAQWVGTAPVIAMLRAFGRIQTWESAYELASYAKEVEERVQLLQKLTEK
jgi:hypothetical protein